MLARPISCLERRVIAGELAGGCDDRSGRVGHRRVALASFASDRRRDAGVPPPGQSGQGSGFASATIEAVTCPYVVTALNKQPDGFTAVTIRTIAEAVEGYLTRRLSLEELIGATISAVDTPQMAIVLCKY